MSETQVTTEDQVAEINDLDAFSTEFFGENKVPEEAAKPDAEQDVEDKTEEGVTEAQTDETEEIEEVEEAPPKKKTVQDRIDELVRKNHETERAAEARIAELQKKFEDAIKAIEPKPTEKKTAEPSPLDQNDDGTDKYPLGEFDPTYIRDLTRFTLEQERTQAKIRDEEERKQQEFIQAEQALSASWNEKLAPAKEKYPDFQEKGQQLIDSFKSSIAPEYGHYLTNLLMSMDNGPDVLYYLSNNPDEAVKIVNSGAQKATLALGRIEAKFIEADQEKQKARPKISKAPPPVPIQNRGTAGGVTSVEPDTDDLDAFTREFFKRRK